MACRRRFFPIHGTKKRICAPTRNGPTSLFDIIKESHDNGEDAPQPPTNPMWLTDGRVGERRGGKHATDADGKEEPMCQMRCESVLCMWGEKMAKLVFLIKKTAYEYMTVTAICIASALSLSALNCNVLDIVDGNVSIYTT